MSDISISAREVGNAAGFRSGNRKDANFGKKMRIEVGILVATVCLNAVAATQPGRGPCRISVRAKTPAEIISLIDISNIVFIERTAARWSNPSHACRSPGERKTNGLTIERKVEKSSFLFIQISASGFSDKGFRNPLIRTT